MAGPSAERKVTCTCGRTFKTDTALQQHQRDSPLHADAGKASNEDSRSAAEAQPGTTVSRTPSISREGEFEDGLGKEEMRLGPCYADFRDELTFPTFDDLPDEDDVDLEYYDTVDGFSYSPWRHWCFLAEITDVELFTRVRLTVRDKAGTTVPVAFYTDGRGNEFAPSQLQPGNTVAILYAHCHAFLDFTVGIRQEEYNLIKVHPL